ncbi:hypothetical protein TanjilG_08397 [Lupinus angustifolius]|uniref:Uncharacterized protein n=1 Tax=Lupinus angustifolius TaxID=3871 RepID=A0A394DQH0_LUPAN|nr:hypothetical protein TanjilG_08397 [Lupinus angustifolius]
MEGIKTLDLLYEEMTKKKSIVPSNWHDRLRSKKGFPVGDSPDLESFLTSIKKLDDLDPQSNNPKDTLSREAINPTNSTNLRKFSRDGPIVQNSSYRRQPRKQSHPTKRIFPSSSSNTNIVVVLDIDQKAKSTSFI